jgi:hypothetical protein
MIYVPTNDGEYHAWLTSNRQGFVVNSDKGLKDKSYPKMHRSTCDHINDPGTPNYTTTDYLKFCSVSREELERWVREIDKRDMKRCKSCVPYH